MRGGARSRLLHLSIQVPQHAKFVGMVDATQLGMFADRLQGRLRGHLLVAVASCCLKPEQISKGR
jgi:hypothetical protein